MELNRRRIVVIGRAGGIAKAVVEASLAHGATVVAAGRNTAQLREVYDGRADVQGVDVIDERSIEELAGAVGDVDHVVVTASARARGATVEIDPELVMLSLQTKVVGPLLVAKHFAARVKAGGSFVFASGATSQRPVPNMSAVAATNGAVDALVRSLAVELAPVRVNAFAPGTIDSGAWDGLGEAKEGFLSSQAERNPVGRVGTPDDAAKAVLFLMANTFVTGIRLEVDGGEPIA